MTVSGEGPMPCDIMVIGEAPGRTEVIEGRPFIGPSGKQLAYLLACFGYDRSDVFITNVVQEMPLGDDGKIRRPFEEECREWRPLLDIELEAVDPFGLLLLGTTAYRAIADDWVGKVPWGTTFIWMERIVGVIWHPSYLLHGHLLDFPKWRQQAQPFFDSLEGEGDSR